MDAGKKVRYLLRKDLIERMRWAYGKEKAGKSTKGRGTFRQFALKFVVFLVVLFFIFYFTVSATRDLKNVLAPTLYKLAHIVAFAAVFAYFVRPKLRVAKPFGVDFAKDSLALVIAAVLFWLRFSEMMPGLDRVFTALGTLFLAFAWFGFNFFRFVLRECRMEIAFTLIVHLYLLMLQIEGMSFDIILKRVFWA